MIHTPRDRHVLRGLLALPILEKAATEPGNIRKRRGAIASLARVAALPTVSSEARQKVVVALQSLLESQGRRLKTSACDALGVLGKESAVALPLLEQLVRSDADGSAPSNVDACNGHTGADGEYHYNTIKTAPYMLGCFHGAFDPSLVPRTTERAPPPGTPNVGTIAKYFKDSSGCLHVTFDNGTDVPYCPGS